jgi:hypothetical protein
MSAGYSYWTFRDRDGKRPKWSQIGDHTHGVVLKNQRCWVGGLSVAGDAQTAADCR